MTRIAKFEGDWTAGEIDAGEAGDPFEVREPAPESVDGLLVPLSFGQLVALMTNALDGRMVRSAYTARQDDDSLETALHARVSVTFGCGDDGSDPQNVVAHDFLAVTFEVPGVTDYVELVPGRWHCTGYGEWATAFSYTVWSRRFSRAGFGRMGYDLGIGVDSKDGSTLAIHWLPLETHPRELEAAVVGEALAG